ncbi:MAG: hypothetical protein ACOC3Z_00370 [Nanoarchaeota archaeon]
MKLSDKKGSHVGIMISFMILIVFIIFIYSALEPAFKKEDNYDLFLNNIEKKLLNSFEERYITNVIKTNEQVDCLEIPIESDDKEYIAFNKTNGFLNTDKKGGNLFVELDSDYAIVYGSELLNSSNTFSSDSCEEDLLEDYKKVILNRKAIFKNKIKNSIKDYNNDYESFKSDLNISSEIDFKFDFSLENGTEIKTNRNIVSENIYSKEIYINYLDENATPKSGKILLKAWRSYE